MKHVSLIMYCFFVFIIAINSGCESLLEPDTNPIITNNDAIENPLHVKFINNKPSQFTITSIQILIMGVAGGEYEDPNGEFGSNILINGETIAPGDSIFFDLEIPASYYSYCRLGVDDGSGKTIYLHEQDNYYNLYEGTITHWGGDDRTVDVTLVRDSQLGVIHTQSWGEWAGID